MADAEVKQEITHVEGGNGRDSDQEASNEFTPAEEKRIKRRIDRRLVTTCGVMYCISLIDRTNLSSAAIAGMNEDLMLVGDRYVRYKLGSEAHGSCLLTIMLNSLS
jgi:hypothetical protein